MKQEETCCFSGHRPDKLPWGDNEADRRCLELKARIRAAVERAYGSGFRHFICGMAKGCDWYFCEAVLALRDAVPGVTLEAAIPCESQSDRWREADRVRWRALVDQCDFETMVQHHYDRGCMQRRDRYMVDRSARLIAVFDGLPGGTQYTVLYAMRHDLAIEFIDLPQVG